MITIENNISKLLPYNYKYQVQMHDDSFDDSVHAWTMEMTMQLREPALDDRWFRYMQPQDYNMLSNVAANSQPEQKLNVTSSVVNI